jgi:cobalt-zinc-cadmium efflux system outer membrane protein
MCARARWLLLVLSLVSVPAVCADETIEFSNGEQAAAVVDTAVDAAVDSAGQEAGQKAAVLPTELDLPTGEGALTEPAPFPEPLPSTAHPVNPVVLDLVALAQVNSPTVAAAKARLLAACGLRLQASLKPNPSVGFAGQEVGNEAAAGQHGIFLQQTFLRGNKIQLRSNVAGHRVCQREIELESSLANVQLQVRQAYYQILVALIRVDVYEELLNSTKQMHQEIERLVQAEELSRTASLQSDLATVRIKTQFQAAEFQRLARQRELAALVGVGVEDLPTMDADWATGLPEYQWDELHALATTESLALRRQDYRIKQASCAVALEQSKQIVDPTWQLSAYYDDSTNYVFAGLSVSRPLQLYDRNQGNIQRACAEKAEATHNYAAIVRQTVVRLAAAYQDYQTQMVNVRAFQNELVPMNKDNLVIVMQALREGELGYLNALVSQQSNIQANQEYLDALEQAWRSVWVLESLLLLPKIVQ